MIEAINLKAGMTFEQNGKLIKVLSADHHKPGKGNTVMRMKLYDIRSGSTVETTMRPEEKVEQAVLETKDAQYLYTQDGTAFFMDLATYEQYELPVESMQVKIEFYQTEVIGLTLPTTVVLTVAETQPSIKGATAASGGKPATMETGLVVTVPDFISAGEKLEINTQKGTYQRRAGK